MTETETEAVPIRATNPFTTAGKVPAAKFVGRRRELAEIADRLHGGNNVSLVGPRRIGKSSLLEFLRHRSGELLGPETRCVYLDLQRIGDERQFWARALEGIDARGEDPQRLLDLSREQPIVLLVDEFEKARNPIHFDLEFQDLLRSYLQERTLTALIATRDPLHEIETVQAVSPLSNIFRRTDLKPLPKDEARELIDIYLEPTGVSFSEDEIDRLLTDSEGHPAELQDACLRLFDVKAGRLGQGGVYAASRALATDAAQAEDWLWGGVYADALADFLAHPDTSPPLVVGIDGAWGAGKSSLMMGVRQRLDAGHEPQPEGEGLSLGQFKKELERAGQEEAGARETDGEEAEPPAEGQVGCETVWFNAWKYSKDEQLWAALLQCILEQLTERMTPARRESFFLRLNLRRIDREKVRMAIYHVFFTRALPWLLLLFFLSILTALLFFIDASAIRWVAPLPVLAIFPMIVEWVKTKKKPIPFKLTDYVKRPQYAQKIGFLGEVERDLRRLQKELPHRRLVIFVDDLDRCSPKKVVELIEAINIFFGMETGRWMFVLGIDSSFVEASLETTYDKLAEKIGKNGFGRQFLEKIVQVWLKLPEPGEEQIASYLRAILRHHQGGPKADQEQVEERKKKLRSEAPDLETLDKVARERLDDPDPAERQVADEAIRQVAAERLTEQDPEVQKVLMGALTYLESNPRQVKRFLNLFRLAALLDLRKGEIEAGGLSREHFHGLAWWVALSLRFPRLARRVKAERQALARLRKAALFEAEWRELMKEPEWKGILETAQRPLLKAEITETSMDFDVLA